MTCRDPQIGDLLGAYVLGACLPDEEPAVREHLTVCEDCRLEFDSLAPVRLALLEALPSAEPDPAMKDAIMARVREEASLFAAAAPAREAAEAKEVEIPERPQSPRRRAFASALLQPARVGALAAVIVAVAVGTIVLGSGGSSSPGGRKVEAEVVRKLAPNGSANLVVGKDGGTLEVAGFPSPGAGRKYQVWLKTGAAAPRPTKVLFGVDAQGRATAKIPGSLSKVDHVLVTSEPAAGSQVPTRNPVMQVVI